MTDRNVCRHVVVLGAQHPTGLDTARSLRGMVARIDGVFFGRTPCETSNIWSNVYHTDKTVDSVLKALTEIAGDSAGPILLFPCDDECVLIISRHRARLAENLRIIMPDMESVETLMDKSRFYDWADENRFPIPQTRVVSGFDEIDKVATEIRLPLVLKPLYRTSRWDVRFPVDKVFILNDKDQVPSLPRDLFELSEKIIVQQWIPGNDAEVYFCLVYYSQEGCLVDYFCGRKLMQWPPRAGSTAIAVSDEDELTRDLTVSLFDRARYQGLGSVEYKRDPRDGALYIMEPTVGRNDFQSYLAVVGNVNLTACALLDSNGNLPVAPPRRRKSLWIYELSTLYSFRYYLNHSKTFKSLVR